tara:strand:- start:676295 stop:676708 length:414 start_codon:yes stop_codon:yes gene_type:complete
MVSFPSLGQADAQSDLNKKRLAAQEFFEVKPVSDMATQAIVSIALSKPAEEQDLFMRQMRVHMDYAALEAAMTDALVDVYSYEEIQAMVDFYGSDLGKSIGAKQSQFEKAVSPILQKMLDKAFVDANYGSNGAALLP